MDDLKTILDRIRKPLTFASRDDFAHLKSLAALEPFIRTQVAELRHLLPNHKEHHDLEQLFAGFDDLIPELKKNRIREASKLIDSLERGQEEPLHQAAMHVPESARQHSSAEHPIPTSLRLDSSIQYCKGIGPKRAALFQKLGIATIEDALLYLPWRYEDRGNLKKIGRLSYGSYETLNFL
jgi:ATP-dependent DNA helicase RecG